MFRYLVPEDPRSPIEPSRGSGRFGAGERLILYTASTPGGAVAEYFRRHPELIAVQVSLKLRIYEMSVSANPTLDVTTAEGARDAAIEPDRLVSSDEDEETRYRECRELATQVEDSGGAGILYPNVALQDGSSWNAALFGERDVAWIVELGAAIQPPRIQAESIHVL
jgi:hypothetical protein